MWCSGTFVMGLVLQSSFVKYTYQKATCPNPKTYCARLEIHRLNINQGLQSIVSGSACRNQEYTTDSTRLDWATGISQRGLFPYRRHSMIRKRRVRGLAKCKATGSLYPLQDWSFSSKSFSFSSSMCCVTTAAKQMQGDRSKQVLVLFCRIIFKMRFK